jgi:hypothetical protein
MHITLADVNNVSARLLVHLPVANHEEFLEGPGRQHYALLAWLSTRFTDKELFDIGTHQGSSAAALAFETTNQVHSFDITLSKLQHAKPNVTYHEQDLWDPATRDQWKSRLLASPLIFLDIDPHDGQREWEFFLWLQTHDYKGMLLLDDIWYFKAMRDVLWYQIPENETIRKWDLTSLGHWSGTGLVDFSGQVTADVPRDDRDQWTLVTAYFDLTKEPDASDSIRSRPLSYYLKEAHTTLCVPQNLVVFCDTTTYPMLRDMRPQHLVTKTAYVVRSFDQFMFVDTGGQKTDQTVPLPLVRAKIIQNRQKKPYQFDARNTASYYLFCMLRYLMVDEVMQRNPFQSTHFAWVNVNIENYGWKNAASLQQVMALYRDGFSTCWIDYIPRDLVKNWAEYFKFGRCGMCSGFFTGDKERFTLFNREILKAFFDCLQEGYGHADEQLYYIVYLRQPKLFHFYFGDYTEMVTNYVRLQDRVTEPVKNIILHAFEHKDYEVCCAACQSVWPVRHLLSDNLKKVYLQCYFFSALKLDKTELVEQLLLTERLT